MDTDHRISELFGYVCKHCTDPRATHERLDNDKFGACFIMHCVCPGYEMDNLKHLEAIEIEKTLEDKKE